MERPPDPEKSNPLIPQSLAAEGTGDQDQNLTARLARYGTAKARNYEMAGFLVLERHQKLAQQLYDCGSFLRFRHYIEHSQTRLVESRSCDVSLLCPLCAIRRGGRLLRRYHERLLHLAGAHDFYLVTLTVKNGPDLDERYRHLLSSWNRVNKRAKKGYGVFADASGAFGSIEFTKSEHGWHPHLHMIWAMPKGSAPVAWGKDSQLGLDWLAASGDSYIVHAERISAGEGTPLGEGTTSAATDPLISALCETLKYALKFSDLPLADNLHAYRTLKGKRLTRAYGCFFGLELPEKLDEDPMDGPYIETLYRWTKSRGYVGFLSPHESPTLSPTRTNYGNNQTHIRRQSAAV